MSIWQYRLPLTPPLPMKYGVLQVREGLFIQEQEQWAEIAPFPGLSQESLLQAGRAWQAGETSPTTDLARALLHPPLPLPMSARVPLNALLTDNLIYPEKQALVLQQQGYRSFKLKVGGRDLKQDINRVLSLRRALGETAEIRLDANRTWTLEQGCYFAEAITRANIAYIEEPLQFAHELPLLAQATGVPIALDESLRDGTPMYFSGLVAVVVKPGVLGWEKTCQWADWAKQKELKIIISSTFETGLLLSFYVRLASYWSPQEAAGLDTWRAYAEEICPWYRVTEGEMWTSAEMRAQLVLNPLYFQKWEV